MAEPRKIFRIEETMAPRRVRAPVGTPVGTLLGAPAAPRCAAVGGASGGDTLALQAEHLTRIVHELEAVTTGTEQSTGKILAAAEEIDQLANNLSAALKGKIEQDLAQDITDIVIRIFEACNFQDLIGQRVSKVMTTIKRIEDHITDVAGAINSAPEPAAVPAPDDVAQLLHGPRLDIDDGHITQAEIDAMFGA